MATPYDSSDSEADDVGGFMTVASEVISSNMEEILEDVEKKLDQVKTDLQEHFAKTIEQRLKDMEEEVTLNLERTIGNRLQKATDDLKKSLEGSLFFKGTLHSIRDGREEQMGERMVEATSIDGPQTSDLVSPIDEQEEADQAEQLQNERQSLPVVTPKRGRPKFHWKGHRQGEEFIKRFLEETDFSRSIHNKKDCYKAGLEKGVWTKGPEWQLRVFHKVDSVAKAHIRKDN